MDAKGKTQICITPCLEGDLNLDNNESQPRFLIVVDGGLPGTMFQLGDTEATLGRSAENAIQLMETTVSRQHARFCIDINGHVGLVDLASTNGTFLNGQRLQPNSPVWMRNGDRVRIGKSVVLKFVRLDPQDERFQRELFDRMVRDSLTGLFNRGYFLEQLGTLEGRSMECGLGLAVILIDIDHFKRINDTYGHDAGDLVLKEVAHLLKESTRPDDLVARYGGEEFVIAIPVDLTDLARERAERIRRQISDRRIRFRNHELRVTVSLGIAFGKSGKTGGHLSLITDADEALYRAKKGGRNRVAFRAESHPNYPTASRSQETASSHFSLIS